MWAVVLLLCVMYWDNTEELDGEINFAVSSYKEGMWKDLIKHIYL